MIIIAGSLSFDPSDREDVLASLAEVTEASRRDAGCRRVLLGRGSRGAQHLPLLRVLGVTGAPRRAPRRAARDRLRRAQPAAHHGRDGDLLRGVADRPRRRPRRRLTATRHATHERIATAVIRLGAQAIDALPPRLRRPCAPPSGDPARARWRSTSSTRSARATALMGPAPDEARALLDGIVLALPSPPPAARSLTHTASGPGTSTAPSRAGPTTPPRGLAVRPGRRARAAFPVPDRFAGAGRARPRCPGPSPRVPRRGRAAARRTAGGRVRSRLGQPDPGPGGDRVGRHRRGARREVLHAHRRRCDGPGRVTVAQGDMLEFAAEEPYDAAVFFESFHHCADHVAMLRRLHDIVRPGRRRPVRRGADTESPLPVGTASRRAVRVVEPDVRLARARFRLRLLRRRPRPHRVVGKAGGRRRQRTDVLVARAVPET